MKKYKILASNTIIFAISNILSKLILSLLLPLYTHELTADLYGKAELLTNISELIVPICSLTIQDALFRFSMDKTKRKEDILVNSSFILAIASVELVAISLFLKDYTPISGLNIYLFLISALSMWRSSFSIYAKAANYMIIFAVDSLLYNGTLGIGNLIFLLIFKLGLHGYFGAMILAYIVSIVFLIFFAQIIPALQIGKRNTNTLRALIKYSLPLVLNSICWGIIRLIDKMMLADINGISSTGIYSVASKIPSLLSMVVGVFTQAWTFSAIQDYETEKDKSFYKNIFLVTHICVIIGVMLILSVNNNLFTFILGMEYKESISYIPVLLLGTAFLSYSNYYSPIFAAVKQTRYIMYSALGGTALNIILNAILIPSLGIMGACIATTLSYLFIAIYRMEKCKKIFDIDIEYVKWFISISIMLICSVSVVINKSVFHIICFSLIIEYLLYKENIRQYIRLGYTVFIKYRKH